MRFTPRPPTSFFNSGTVVLPAGATVPYNCTGQLFICKEASAAFKMSMNDGAFFSMEVGLGFRLNNDDQFTKLSFQNESASIITVQFYTGVGEILDNRLNTVIDRLVIVGLKDVSDSAEGYDNDIVTVDSGTPVSLAGTHPTTGKQRKQVVITNLEAADWLLITDSAGGYFAAVPPQQSWTMCTSADLILTIYPAGGAVDCIIGQTYYTS